jgi:hypothetical protein
MIFNVQSASQASFGVNNGEDSKSLGLFIPSQVNKIPDPGSGPGQDSRVTKPLFQNEGKQQNMFSSLQESSIREDIVMAGRGRGRSMTLPAWMTK